MLNLLNFTSNDVLVLCHTLTENLSRCGRVLCEVLNLGLSDLFLVFFLSDS